jgi:hypothetical protein
MPPEAHVPSTRVQLAPQLAVESMIAARWVRGSQHISIGGDEQSGDDFRMYMEEISDFEWSAMQTTGLWHLQNVLVDLTDALATDDDDGALSALGGIRDELERQEQRLLARKRAKELERENQ